MKLSEIKISDEVVRSKGDYVVGRIGNVINIDTEKQRAQIKWNGYDTTWVSLSAIELTCISYKIIPSQLKNKYTYTNPKYIKL